MIRIETTRRIDCRQGKGRNKVNPNSVMAGAADIDEALADIRAARDGGERIAPGYMPMIEARLFDWDAYTAWVRNGGDMPSPLRVLDAADIAAL